MASGDLQLLTVVIPARNEEGCIRSTVAHLDLELRLSGIPHEIIVVDDGSTDQTWKVLQDLREEMAALHALRNDGPHGFGRAVIQGLDGMTGDAVVIMMADESDDCRDVVTYWNVLNEGHDAVFGSRFIHFNLTVELPLKTIVRGYSWTVIPITWRNRRTGEPKLKLKEMGSRYLFICLYVWLEKYFSRGDYRKEAAAVVPQLTKTPTAQDGSSVQLNPPR